VIWSMIVQVGLNVIDLPVLLIVCVVVCLGFDWYDIEGVWVQ